MGIYGEYRPLVGLRLFVLALTTVLVSEPVLAQSRAESPPGNVQRRRAESNQRINPYWDGFILKHQGNCREAIAKLKPLAKRGFGYEDAQTALGECYLQLAGMDTDGGSAPDRDKMFAIAEFQSGLDWISKASRAGHFEAQAVMIALYAAGLGPDEDKIEAAKWAHLYLTNPSRLNLGFFPNTILNDLAIDLQDIFGHPANESLELRQSWLLQTIGVALIDVSPHAMTQGVPTPNDRPFLEIFIGGLKHGIDIRIGWCRRRGRPLRFARYG